MSKLTLEKINDVHIKVHCESDVAYELSDYFTFTVPGAKFIPSVRNKFWDGKIRLFNSATKRIYTGLRLHVELFARERNYEVDYLDLNQFAETSFSEHQANDYIKSLELAFTPRDYQVQAFIHAIRTRRTVLLSPTASGKSLIIYMISRFLYDQGSRVLIVVPTTSLVHQMASDFGEYSELNSDDFCHKIFSGQENIVTGKQIGRASCRERV